MAAAICWENYMPLLRQALYAQNINLYLAPTADGRDTWLSLLRTMAVEGRCFVVSSNMCVRNSTATAAGSSTAGTTSSPDPEATEALQFSEPVTTTDPRRRNSCVTEEGFEIALPSASPHRARSPNTYRRRQSILDEDGNEIIIPCGSAVTTVGLETPNHTRKPHRSTLSSSRQAAPTEMNGGHQNKSEFISRGGSSIVSPFGEVLAGPQWEDDQGIVYADVDFEDCIRGRLDLDTGGSYSRFVHSSPLSYFPLTFYYLSIV
jgi:nitrilase